MKNKSIVLFFTCLAFTFICNATTYYINADFGNDSNSGKSKSKAWQSLNKVNESIFKPGDKILFKKGTVYYGQLEPKGSGKEGSPIIIDSYGKGKKPIIHGEGKKLHTLLLFNIEYWEIKNLEITNQGKQRKARRRGVLIEAEDYGDVHHIVLDNLEVHHVNGSLVKEKGGGSAIFWKNSGKKVKTRFVDLAIQNCYLHHSGRNGITSNGNSSRDFWHPSIGVVIRNNLLEQIPGDGIVPIGCDGALIENNLLRDFSDILSHEEAAAGIWPWSSDNTIIQFNEVSGHKAKWDGQGFDSDYNCQGTIIQNNYSHDNYGGFLLICNDGSSLNSPWNMGTKKTIIRNNISINDGIRPYPTKREGNFCPIIHMTGPVENTEIYNNIIVAPKISLDNTIVKMDNWGGPWPKKTIFKNNVFFSETTSSFEFGKDKNTIFEKNLYFGDVKNLPKDVKGIYSDPEFLDMNISGRGFQVLKGYFLSKTSPIYKKDIGVSKVNLKKMMSLMMIDSK